VPGRAARNAHGRGRRGAPSRRRQFLERTARILDVSEQAAEELFSAPRGASVRINRLSPRPAAEILGDVEGRGFALEPIPWCPDAYALDGAKHELGQSDLFQRGDVYIQNASSLVPALALDPQPGDAILDVCAAPGGKAAHLAALVAGDCALWLNDPIKPRLERLREVVATFGLAPERITDIPGQYVDKFIDRRFDRILLDAQCSGEGRIDLRRRDALALWSPARIEHYRRLQQRMLVAAFKLLEPGGTLVYATCTLAPEENEAPVSHLLAHHPDAQLAPLGVALEQARPARRAWGGQAFHADLRHARRIVPDRLMEAFFVAKIVKRAA
jgi:tRNA (cytosine49-C5)-methyltransferase